MKVQNSYDYFSKFERRNFTMAIEKITLNKVTPATAPTPETASATQSKSKTIQSEITRKQQHMKKLSSDSSMTATEIEQKRRELQKEIDELNRKLELMRQEQKQEDEKAAKERIQKADRQKELREQATTSKIQEADSKTANTAKEDEKRTEPEKNASNTSIATQKKREPVSMSAKEVHEMLSAENLIQKERVQESVKTKTEGTIHVIESEIKQDKGYGSDTSAKEAELDSIRQKENFWTDAQKQNREKTEADAQAKTTMHQNAQVVLDQI